MNYLNEKERKIFINKMLPLAFFGSLIWFFGGLLFGALYLGIETFARASITLYFPMIFVNLILSIISFVLAKNGDNKNGLLLYLVFSFTAGFLNLPILMFTNNYFGYIYACISMGIGPIGIVYLVALIFQNNFLKKGFVLLQVIIVGLLILGMEFLLIYLLQLHNPFTMIISAFFFVYIALMLIFYGGKLAKEIRADFWMFWALRLLFVLLYSIIAIILLVALFLILAALGGGDGSFNFSGGGGSGKSSSSKKGKAYKKSLN